MKNWPSIGVFGFPKSGNTWVQGIFAIVGKEIDPAYVQHDIHVTRQQKIRFKPHPVIKLRGDPCVVFKSHDPYDSKQQFLMDASDLGISELAKVVSIKRNPFDMLLSFLNYSIWAVRSDIRTRGKPRKTLDEYLRKGLGLHDEQIEQAMEQKDVLTHFKDSGICDLALQVFIDESFSIPPFKESYGSWFDHILSWENQRDFPKLSIRYEDLILDRKGQAERLAKFVNIPTQKIEAAFSRQDAHTNRLVETDKQKAGFFNKRECGYFWRYYSENLLHDVIESESHALQTAGYDDLRKICPPPV